MYLDFEPNLRRCHNFIDSQDCLDIWQALLGVCRQSNVHIAVVLLKALSKDPYILQARVQALTYRRGHGVCCITQQHSLQDT